MCGRCSVSASHKHSASWRNRITNHCSTQAGDRRHSIRKEQCKIKNTVWQTNSIVPAKEERVHSGTKALWFGRAHFSIGPKTKTKLDCLAKQEHIEGMKALSTLERQERSLALDGKKALHGKEHRAETALCGKEHVQKEHCTKKSIVQKQRCTEKSIVHKKALHGKEHRKKKSHTERETSETLWGK
jgi:hypothetical protein